MPGCRAKRPGAALTRGARAVGGHQPAVQRAAHRARARAHAPGGQRQAQGQLQREAVCGQPAGHRAGAGQHSARRGPHQPRRAPSPLISALILPCWSPCRRRTTRRAPTSTPASARARPASPPSCDPYPNPALLVTVPIPDNTARAEVHTSLGARPAPPFAGRNGLSGREASPPSCSPCCAHVCAPAQAAERTCSALQNLSSAALRRARLLRCMPACDVRRPGFLSLISTKALKTSEKSP